MVGRIRIVAWWGGGLFPYNDSELVIHTDEDLPNSSYSFSVDDVGVLQ